ncbi:MAG TPA: type II toxin-antitoxin system RelE/ParE family toxin [Syntrophales bacterium]|nr:type II toxin-antitoxin system RelE/ParE family toxin [Syntrophales bacterium]
MRILFTPSGRSNFLAAMTFIDGEDASAAASFRKKSEKTLLRLKRFPGSGTPLPEFPDLPFREVTIPPCRFIFRVKQKTVWIVAVWRGARLPKKPAEKEIA